MNSPGEEHGWIWATVVSVVGCVVFLAAGCAIAFAVGYTIKFILWLIHL